MKKVIIYSTEKIACISKQQFNKSFVVSGFSTNDLTDDPQAVAVVHKHIIYAMLDTSIYGNSVNCSLNDILGGLRL